MSTLNSAILFSHIGGWPLLGLIAPVLAWALMVYQKRSRLSAKEAMTLSQREKVPFQTPRPQPLTDIDPNTKSPKLYRPFRRGPNNITMGIRRVDWNNWIEMDSYFLRYHQTKASELKKDFNEHVKYVDNEVTKDACFEVYEELAAFLTHRYPKIFQRKEDTIHNTLTNEDFPYPASTIPISFAKTWLIVAQVLPLKLWPRPHCWYKTILSLWWKTKVSSNRPAISWYKDRAADRT